MNLAHLAISHSRFTFVIYLCIALVGIAAFSEIPKQEDPDINSPSFTVVATYPGANASEIEQSVVRPMEEALKELDEVEKITSTVRDGFAMTEVDFFFGPDVDRKYEEVIRQTGVVRPRLPAGVEDVEVRRFQTIDVAAMQLALVSKDADIARLQDVAEALRKRLETVPQVRQVRKHAYPEKQVNVSLDMGRLATLGIPLGQVLQVIEGDNATVSAGAADSGARRFNIKGTGAYPGIEAVRNTPVRSHDGAVTRLRDIARVEWGTEEIESYGRYDGERAMFLSVRPRAEQNLFDLSAGVREEIGRFQKSLPADMRIEIGWDQSSSVGRRMDQLRKDFIIALCLVAVTILPLGTRAAVLVMVSIPLSLAMGVTALHFSGFSLNQLSIVGAVIALGLLVDDSIVVVENVARYRRDGHSAVEAAVLATRQITPAVISTTLILVAAFLPLLMMPGVAGQFISSLALAVVYTVSASMIVALTIIPLLARFMLGGHGHEEGNVLLRALQRGISASYRPVLHLCMKHRVATLLVAALLVAGGFALVPRIGFSLFPKADLPQFLVQIEAEEGAGIPATEAITKKAEAILKAYPGVINRFTTVGDGNPQIYYNVGPQSAKANTAEIFAALAPYDPVSGPATLAEIRRKMARIPGARIVVKEFENGGASDAPVEIRLICDDLDALTAMAKRVEESLMNMEGTHSVKNPLRVRRTDLRVVMEEGRAAVSGVLEKDVDEAARLAFAGLPAGYFREADGDEYPIRVQLPRTHRAALDNWNGLQVWNAGAATYVPVAQVARLEMESAPPLIERYNQERSITVTSLVKDGYNVATLTAEVGEKLAALDWPTGMRWEFGGEEEERNDTFGGLGMAVLFAGFGILAILVLQFGSFRGTAIVASVIPLGFIGGFVALWLTGYTLSFTAGVGFIALIGIEIKNSILLVDFTNELRAGGIEMREAIEQAGEVRFLPVVLTTLTAFGALLPLALQHSGLYSPLAIVIMGGLVSSLFLSRVVTPVLYSLIPPSAGISGSNL